MNAKSTLLLLVSVAVFGTCSDENVVETTVKAGVSADTFVKSAPATTKTSTQRPEGWDDYWYSGKAEVNTYNIVQKRYGEKRNGDAILIFVTEPFLPKVQVKNDGRGGQEESISVLKLNRIHRFNTGVYDYSLMLSAFTPVSRNQYQHTLKTTLSAQDWCGHSWWQLNFRGTKYEAQRRSYFQSEADAVSRLEGVLLEDELLNLVRLDPGFLPSGKTKVIPGAMFSALFHVMPEPQEALVSYSSSKTGEQLLTIQYPKFDRSLVYRFSESFPNKLLGWKETYKGELLSEGNLKHSSQQAYWSQNRKAFDYLRDTLKL